MATYQCPEEMFVLIPIVQAASSVTASLICMKRSSLTPCINVRQSLS